MWKFILWNVLAIALLKGGNAEFSDVFDEEMFVKPLSDKFVYSYFQFTTRWELGKNDSLLHTNLVSRPLAELFYHFGVQELHLSFTYGLWRYESWGYPVTDAGPGAEVWAWFEPTSDRASIDHRWKMLCGTLSGLFCASLSFIDPSNTYEPAYTLRPQTHHFPGQSAPILRYAALPREIVCTENLTPWAKLLPCRSREGLVSLLVPDSIYASNYHSLGVHMRKLCADAECSEFQLEVKQTVSVVQDLRLFGGTNWSLRKLFGQGMEGSCALATTSNVYIDVTDNNGIEVSQKPDETILSVRGGTRTELQRFDVKQFEAVMAKGRRAMFNVAVMDKRDPNVIVVAGPPPIFAKRFILGVGQERGKIVTHITNAHWGALDLIVFETIPWFVPIYLHTLTIRHGGVRIEPAFLHYTPGVQRERPYGLEVAFRIPARATVELSIDFDYIFLKWQEYPPDANHGHYIPSSIISLLLPSARNYTSIPREAALFRDSFNATQLAGYFLQIRTESLLLTLPTPDFSMPYNVICLACTVVALAFGPIHNISTKRIVAKGKEASKTSLGEKVKQFFKSKSKQAKEEQTASTEDLNAPDTE
ncbi:GPI transamidase component PIG-T [Anopheles marshallii]|uniref:GPI transamidase component PIG-T n=1 Tax=Anopheles marshallii TaxID=1521116 RepID=UPI00237A7A34|nr:GPI transamidase component PIG-T [Anopheles marshallii]